jgi:hypothetical protein
MGAEVVAVAAPGGELDDLAADGWVYHNQVMFY